MGEFPSELRAAAEGPRESAQGLRGVRWLRGVKRGPGESGLPELGVLEESSRRVQRLYKYPSSFPEFHRELKFRLFSQFLPKFVASSTPPGICKKV